MRVALVTPPAGLPVSLEEDKAHLRVTEDAEDALILGQIKAAVAEMDGYRGTLGRCIMEQTWAVHLDGWWDTLRLPFTDVRDIAVTYLDADGVEQTVDPGLYTYAYWGTGYGLRFEVLFNWPPLFTGEEPVTVTFTSGAATADEVDPGIKQAVLIRVEALHDRLPEPDWLPSYRSLVGRLRSSI